MTSSNLNADLRKLVADEDVVVIVASGVSVAATNNAAAASWIGLLKLGVTRCRKVDPTLANRNEPKRGTSGG